MPFMGPGGPGWNTAKHTKADVTAVTAWSTANSPVTLFTVTGAVLARVYAYSTAAMTSVSNTGTLAVGVAGATTAFLGTTTINTTNFPTAGGEAWVDTSATLKVEPLPGTSGWQLLVDGTDIILTIVTNNMDAGGMVVVCDWIPLSSDGAVAAAA